MSFTVVKDSYPNIVKDGLVLNVDAGSRLSYSGSGTTWNDISGSGNNGTLTNGPTYSSANSGSIVFDGTNDYVNTPNSASLLAVGNGSFTFASWFKLSGTKTWAQNLIRRDNFLVEGGENRRIIAMNITANTNFVSFGIYDGGGNNAITSQNLSDGLWHYVVGVRESSTGTNYVYVDGVLKAQAVYNNTQPFNTSNASYAIGNVSSNYTAEPFFGNIAQAQIYNRALSAAEILQNYNALLPRYYSIVTSGLVLNLDAGNPNSYSPPRSDQYASSLVLAVPMNGANNGTTFTDQSAIIKGSGTAKAITRNGDTKTLTAQSKFYGSSGFFDGTGDYLSIPDDADFDLGTSNFTIEGFVYVTATSGSQQTFIAKGTGANFQASYHIALTAGGTWVYYLSGNGSTWSIASAITIGTNALNTWQHIALVRNGSTFTPYLNGVAGTPTTSSTALFDSNKIFSVGADDPGNQLLFGYLQDLRIYKGVAKYTTNFKPPSISSGVTISSASGGVPILNTTDDYGTVNGSSGTTWTDISGNGNTGTLTNGPTYNGANYGSIVFDGVDDYVSKSSWTNPPTNTLTIGCWVKFSDNVTDRYVLSFGKDIGGATGGLALFAYGFNVVSDVLIFEFGSGIGRVSSGIIPSLNIWYYLTVTADATNTKFYLNGELKNTSSQGSGAITSLPTLSIGSYVNGVGTPGTYFHSGNIAQVSVYNTALTAAEVLQNYNATKWRYGI